MHQPNKRSVGLFLLLGIMLFIGSIFVFFGHKFINPSVTPVLFFEGSVNGLNVGSPVYFRGVPVGKVQKIQLISNATAKIVIPVYIQFDKKALATNDDNLKNWINELVAHGLKGKLQSQNLLTGQMMIELNFYPKYQPNFVAYKYGIANLEIPTVPSTFDEIHQNLDKIPISDISNNMNELLANLSVSLPVLVQQTSEAVITLNKLLNTVTQPGSNTINDFNKMVRDVSTAAQSVKNLSEYLERHPEALLNGKKGY